MNRIAPSGYTSSPSDDISQGMAWIDLMNPARVQNALIPSAVFLEVTIRNSILQRLQQRRSCDNTAQAARDATQTQITVDGALSMGPTQSQGTKGATIIKYSIFSEIAQKYGPQLLIHQDIHRELEPNIFPLRNANPVLIINRVQTTYAKDCAYLRFRTMSR